LVNAVDKLGEMPLKTPSFRCRHRVQAPKISKELRPSLRVLMTKVLAQLTGYHFDPENVGASHLNEKQENKIKT
jgi:hypothetical protein